MSKKIIIIAGPNGAGKTTFARSFLPEEAEFSRFINGSSRIAVGEEGCGRGVVGLEGRRTEG